MLNSKLSRAIVLQLVALMGLDATKSLLSPRPTNQETDSETSMTTNEPVATPRKAVRFAAKNHAMPIEETPQKQVLEELKEVGSSRPSQLLANRLEELKKVKNFVQTNKEMNSQAGSMSGFDWTSIKIPKDIVIEELFTKEDEQWVLTIDTPREFDVVEQASEFDVVEQASDDDGPYGPITLSAGKYTIRKMDGKSLIDADVSAKGGKLEKGLELMVQKYLQPIMKQGPVGPEAYLQPKKKSRELGDKFGSLIENQCIDFNVGCSVTFNFFDDKGVQPSLLFYREIGTTNWKTITKRDKLENTLGSHWDDWTALVDLVGPGRHGFLVEKIQKKKLFSRLNFWTKK